MAADPHEQRFSEALLAHGQGNFELAETKYCEVLKNVPNHSGALHYLGLIHLQKGDLGAATVLISASVSENPAEPDSLCNLSFCFNSVGRFSEAIDLCKRALLIDPKNDRVWTNLGNAHRALGHITDSQHSYMAALELEPLNPHYMYNLANIYFDQGNWAEARARYTAVLNVESSLTEAHHNLSVCLLCLNEPEVALVHACRVIELNPDYSEAYVCKGSALLCLDEPHSALANFDRALEINPNHAEALRHRGKALLAVGQVQAAVAAYRRSAELNPTSAAAWADLGALNTNLGDHSEALRNYNEALSRDPGHPEALCNQGVSLSELGAFNAALQSYDLSLASRPNHAVALRNKGDLLNKLKDFQDGLKCLQAAYQIDPNIDFLAGSILHTKLKLCDWDNLGGLVKDTEESIRRRQPVISPFAALGLLNSPALQRIVSEVYVESKCIASQDFQDDWEQCSTTRVRIGYYSSDLYNHATSYLIAELFELHDRKKFEVYIFSFGPRRDDPMSQRIQNAADFYFDVQEFSNPEIVELSRKHKILVAVDLKGHTLNSRPDIFRLRVAPIQISYLGFPGTTGMREIDFILADRTVLPEDHAAYFSEKIIYLPTCYQINDSKRASDLLNRRQNVDQDCPVGTDAFVFCCFNNNWKILPETFDTWMQILREVESSVLWLYVESKEAQVNLWREATRQGVERNRILFAEPVSHVEHLARYRWVDLFLDTFPCGAHTTASDALFAGVPLLTRCGETFASRVASSLLACLGVGELVTRDFSEYKALAIKIARNPELLLQLKERIALRLPSSAVFDTKSQARHIECAYLEAVELKRKEIKKPRLVSGGFSF